MKKRLGTYLDFAIGVCVVLAFLTGIILFILFLAGTGFGIAMLFLWSITSYHNAVIGLIIGLLMLLAALTLVLKFVPKEEIKPRRTTKSTTHD